MFEINIEHHESVEKLEELRKLPYNYWEDDECDWYETPSRALSYAIHYRHVEYAMYLLSQYEEEALDVSRMTPCFGSLESFHLTLAVRYNTWDVFIKILKIVRRTTDYNMYMDKLNTPLRKSNPLIEACKKSRMDYVLVLLAHGAQTQSKYSWLDAPLDIILEKLWVSEENRGIHLQCLNYLLWFSPCPVSWMKECLQCNEDYWQEILDEGVYDYIVGRAPATLCCLTMQTLLKSLKPWEYPDNILKLPLPRSLKPLPQSEGILQGLQR
ncbi:ankyrin repeat domain-containing protein 9-like [Pelodytes ibericus]